MSFNKKIEIDPEKQFKKDITLNLNDFKQTKFFEDREALARMIHHVLLTKQGTYPNNPTFGVGIENYVFEKASAAILNDLTTTINEQIEKWITVTGTEISITSSAKYIKNPENPNYINLAVYFKVSRESSKFTEEQVESFDLTMYLMGNAQQRQVLSKLEIN